MDSLAGRQPRHRPVRAKAGGVQRPPHAADSAGDFCDPGRNAVRSMRLRDPANAKKIRFVAEAAKFREETPRKGGGLTDGSVIPRCNNMMERNFVRKS